MIRTELKQNAKNQLRGNWTWAIGVTLIISIVNLVISIGYFQKAIHGTLPGVNYQIEIRAILQTILSIFTNFFALSFAISFLNLTEGKKDSIGKAAFSMFYNNLFTPELLNYIMQLLFEFFWSLLLIIPGIIKSYSYALTPYIVKDMVESGQKVTYTTGVTASKELMQGHKWELFVLDLSFAGWYLLLIFLGAIIGVVIGSAVHFNLTYIATCSIVAGIAAGIGNLWLTPYVQTTKANFYRQLAGDQFQH
ncbi:DUF975 family protein [Lactobacillus sp. ESL0791]|uniref:DUF975 family protein n=1 Tax=Lactobacillus sp. ESL0791 TaxID=2983234 RepID=UPI0023F70264|nr:DUF975 family protein [Lactobacillus sp. ESL0791]MDF7637982.1 DUF975 family protein [Lactobacillus sp. ESL0791]